MTDPGTAGEGESAMLARWMAEQQEWLRTMTSYFDEAAKNEEFLTHLGNALRGSLLAGKAYPGTVADPEPAPGAGSMDELLFAIRRLEGEVRDLALAVEELPKKLSAGPTLARASKPASGRRGK